MIIVITACNLNVSHAASEKSATSPYASCTAVVVTYSDLPSLLFSYYLATLPVDGDSYPGLHYLIEDFLDAGASASAYATIYYQSTLVTC